jgi:hypothetical protein
MTLEEYIQKAREEYPNGYSDYLINDPEGTPDAWVSIWYPESVKVYNGYRYDRSEMSIIDLWELEKFHTFIGGSDYEFEQHKTNKGAGSGSEN